MCVCVCVCVSCSVASDSLWLHGLLPAWLPCPRNSPGKNTGVGNHSFLQEIFLTQVSNSHLLHCRQIFLQSEPTGKPILNVAVYICQPQSPNSSHCLPFPPWHLYVYSLHLCLYFCFAKGLICCIFLDSAYDTYVIHILFFWFASLCMAVPKPSHVFVNGSILFFLWLSNIHYIYLYVCATSSLSIPLLMDI